MNNGDILRKAADEQGLPLRTLAQVKAGLEQAKKTKADVSMARLMLNHGRLTEEAREYVAREYTEMED
jgi:hypothetical protein